VPLDLVSTAAINEIKTAAGNKRIVFVSGNFNVIHPGHLRLLRFAKECGDYLVVGVLSSIFPDAFIPEELRLESLRSISWIDYSCIISDNLRQFIEELKPAFVVKGKEHETMANPESDIVKAYGGKLLFGSGDVIFSSIDLIKSEWKQFNPSTIQKPLDYPKRHQFSYSDLIPILEKMVGLRVCVIGDVIVDEYITCDPLGMSQEDPTIVVAPLYQESFVGGAGIVAAHAKGFGATVHFFTVVGKDPTAGLVKSSAERFGVELHWYEDESRPTTLKQRYRAGQKTLLRVSHLRQHAIGGSICKAIMKDVLKVIDNIDMLIFSDFSYGCLPQVLVDGIAQECTQRDILMVADSQSSSQVGDIGRFKNMLLVTPTEREARLSLHDFDSGLVGLAESLKQQSKARNIIITLGAEGILIHAELNENNSWLTDRLPALNTSPKDVAGAGDSFLTSASMALAVGADIWKSACLGSLAAACQVGRIGNIPLTTREITLEISR
jgi:rfaE bifunctional protein kinase chain/domain